jgi:class 3 adenylate cyclase
MSAIKIAHVKAAGTEFVFVPLAAEVARLASAEQGAVVAQLREICRIARLDGVVVPVWRSANGLAFVADKSLQPLLARFLTLDFVRNNLNRQLTAALSPQLARLTTDPLADPALRPPATQVPASAAAPAARPAAAGAGARVDASTVAAPAHAAPANCLKAMLFSDLVGSTKLKQQYGDAESMALIRRHHEEVRKLLASTATGQEVSTAGDSFFIVFATPSEAVMFALKWQDLTRRLAEAEQMLIQNRIGIHVGEVVADTHKVAGKEIDFNGIQVDTAARVMSLAQGNQILLSKFSFENARQMLEGMEIPGIGPLTWKIYGLYEVKGVTNPLEIFEVGETGLACLRAPQDTEKAKRVPRP